MVIKQYSDLPVGLVQLQHYVVYGQASVLTSWTTVAFKFRNGCINFSEDDQTFDI